MIIGPHPFRSLEPEARRQLLRKIGSEHGLKYFVETGTNMALTPLALQDAFSHLVTIELSTTLAERAARLLARYPHVQCLQGDSATVLPGVLEDLHEPALFWLDGHYSGPGTAHGRESSPIRTELKLILNHHRAHVILIDDARIFAGGPEHTLYPHYAPYPSIGWVAEFAASFGYDTTLDDDILCLICHAPR